MSTVVENKRIQAATRVGKVALAALLLSALPMLAQQPVAVPPIVSERPVVALADFAIPPPIDASANLSEWADHRLSLQFSPFQPSSKGDLPVGLETVVYAGWGKRGLYVAVEALDATPEHIVAGVRMRDTIPKVEDYISLVVDPTGRGHYGYEFRVSASGVQMDSRIVETSGPDTSYDLLWESSAIRTSRGYLVKMMIPFASLGEVRAAWRFRVLRNWPRDRFYTVTWPLQNDQHNAFLANSGTVTGCSGSHGENALMAIVSATGQKAYAVDSGAQTDRNLGLDLRWRSPNGTRADLTVRPDFSTVESDVNPLAVNTRFKTQLPEKRPFFQEGMETLVDNNVLQQLDTRSILRPQLGLKSSSTSGDLSWGLLAARDNGGGDAMATDGAVTSGLRTNDFVGALTYGDKLSNGIEGRSGLTLTNRAVLDAPGGAGWRSTTYGLHTVQQYGGVWTVYGDGVVSDYRLPLVNATTSVAAPAVSTRGAAFGYGVSYDDEHVNAALSNLRISPDSRFDMGFLSLSGISTEKADLSYRIRSNQSFWTQLKIGVEAVTNNNWDGSPFSHSSIVTATAFFKQTINLSVSRQLASREWYLGEAYDTPNTLVLLSVGAIPGQRFFVGLNPGKVIDYYQGISVNQTAWLGGLTGRVGPVSYRISPVSIELTDPNTGLVTLRASRVYNKVEWALPVTNWFFRTEYQVVKTDRLAALTDPSVRRVETVKNWGCLLRWQPNPFAGVYLGYSQSRDATDNLGGAQDYDHLAQKGLFLKVSYSVQF